jgi:hypothetical protein
MNATWGGRAARAGANNTTSLNSFLTVPGPASENECHKLALPMGAINHKCYAYELAVPHASLADAVQDAVQDGDVVLQ